MVYKGGGWIEGFISSATIILVSEIGDKTFFIACLMAMRHSKMTVYIGAVSALAAMTILSALMGIIVPNVLSVRLTQLISIVLFFIFGIKIMHTELWKKRSHSGRRSNTTNNNSMVGTGGELINNTNTDSSEEEMSSEDEMAEAAAVLRAAEEPESVDRFSIASSVYATLSAKRWRKVLNPIMVEAFTLVFLAEWGDRSQLATIALAASKNAYAVTLGGIVGHAICTACAVLSGNMVARRVSPRFINLLSGTLFLIFAVATLIEYVNGSHVIEQTDLTDTTTTTLSTTTRKPKFVENNQVETST